MSSITVVYPNIRRASLTVDPHKTLFAVLDEACKRQGLQTNAHILKFHGRTVDLATTFRLSGLPNNCQVEMVEIEDAGAQAGPSSSTVLMAAVAVQFENGQRHMDSFGLDRSLWDVLVSMDTKNSLNLQLSAPDVASVPVPVVQYLNSGIIGSLNLQHIKLQDLGITPGGRVLFRFSRRMISEAELLSVNQAVQERLANDVRLQQVFEQKREEQRLYDEQRLKQQEQTQNPHAHHTNNAPSAQTAQTTQSVIPKFSAESRPQESTSARLNRLQNMLGEVDTSLQNRTDLPQWGVVAPTPETLQQEIMVVDFSNFKFPEETRGKDLRQLNDVENNPVNQCQPCDRQMVIFRQEVSTPVNEEPPPNFFELTVGDAQLMHRRLQEERASYSNRALVSDAHIKQQNEVRKAAAWRFTVIRFQFPGNLRVQAIFHSAEWVLLPNFTVPEERKTLISANLSPASTLSVRASGPNENLSLRADLANTVTNSGRADEVAKTSLSGNKPFEPYKPVINQSGASQDTAPPFVMDNGLGRARPRGSHHPAGGQPKPKWFRTGNAF